MAAWPQNQFNQPSSDNNLPLTKNEGVSNRHILFSYSLIYSKMRYNAEQASLSQATSSASRWGERVSKTRWW